jgi:anti-sigma B factor antagonist
MPKFQINSEAIEDGVACVSVEGFLDAHTFEQMESTINSLFTESTYKVMVELSKVDYISSAGAGVFIGAIGTAQENGGNIILMNPTENVKEVFDLLGLSQLFQFAESVDQAKGLF